MGGGDLKNISKQSNVQVVGLCDIDSRNLAKGGAKFPDAAQFEDYREMLVQLGDKVDAVSISTPDHTHYPATVAAMNAGKHVYTQKPLTHEIAESRHLFDLAQKTGLVTQMGIQIHASIGYRMTIELIQSGLIGKVSNVHVWSYKVKGDDNPVLTGEDSVPSNLNWNLWLGRSTIRPYLDGQYHPYNWRNHIEFGNACLGDMGIHIFDTPYAALKLTAPKWVKTSCREPNGLTHPTQSKVEYGFDATPYTTNELLWTWYDGAYAPPSATDNPDLAMPDGRKLPDQGAMIVGEGGRILLPHPANPEFLPASLKQKIVKRKLKPKNHYQEWVEACRGIGKTSAGFDYSAPLTEALLLGVLAMRYPGKKLEWDAANMKITNVPEANRWVSREYRDFDKEVATYTVAAPGTGSPKSSRGKKGKKKK